jgi:hypothetical protein
MKTKECSEILINDLRNQVKMLWKNNSNPIRLEYLKKLIIDLEGEFNR